MAFNIQTFKTRALTAVVFVVIMLAGLLWNHWTFLLLFTIIHFGCWNEYQFLLGKINKEYSGISSFHKYGSMMMGFGIMLWVTNAAFHFATITLHEVGFWLILVFALVLPVIEILFSLTAELKNIGISLLGIVYISLSWALMIDLRQHDMLLEKSTILHDNGWIIPVFLIGSIWINDTMAYIVGSFLGKTPLSSISPKKTWEGTIGGAVLCIAVVAIVSWFFFQNMLALLVGIAAIAAIAGTIGDLVQSKLKRLADVKDSGNIMPGHGGFLDRFDSLILATPFAWLYVKLFF